MQVTIIKDDNLVIINGEARAVDCSALPADFHALQWDGARGEVEYRMVHCAYCGGHSKKINMPISDLEPYKMYLDGWTKAKLDAA